MFESIATFLGLLAGGTAIALKDPISNYNYTSSNNLAIDTLRKGSIS